MRYGLCAPDCLNFFVRWVEDGPLSPHLGAEMSGKRDYYEVLGLDRDADEKALKNAFRRLARKYHPDRSEEPDAEDRFKEIQEAYAVLSDASKRSQYDRFGHDGPSGGFGGGFGGGFNVDLGDLFGGSDIFSAFFGGGGGGGQRKSRGSDILYRHTVSSEDVMNGADEEVELDLPAPCSLCSSTGAEGGALEVCATCSGRGVLSRMVQMGPFQTRQDRTCSECNGRGKIPKSVCKKCRGRGRVEQTSTLRFSVPAGAEDGTRLRLRGKGEPGRDGQPAGDLLVELEVSPHSYFERSRSDLIMSLPLGYADLALGTTITLDHLDGSPLEIRVPKGSTAGDTIDIARRGFPRLRGGGRGDVVVLLKLHMPKKFSRSARSSLEELREHMAPSDLEERIREEADVRRRGG